MVLKEALLHIGQAAKRGEISAEVAELAIEILTGRLTKEKLIQDAGAILKTWYEKRSRKFLEDPASVPRGNILRDSDVICGEEVLGKEN